jgi:histidinol-phosphate aminotransferase
MNSIRQLARPDILALRSYEHAAWESGFTRLHANELPWRTGDDESEAGLNRYPEPQPRALITRLAQLYQVEPESLLMTRGSDEAIDLLVRAFCRAGQDAILICPPTFGMYAMAAQIQDALIISVPLIQENGFALDAAAVLGHWGPKVKLVFLCSPNNPTGNLLEEEAILQIADSLAGRALVVVDEAYIEFSSRASLAPQVARRPHLAVLRTLSKAHGLAGARLGTLIANPEVIGLLRKLIAPYAIPQLTLEAVLTLLSAAHLRTLPRRVREIRTERETLAQALEKLPGVTAVLPSEANFLLTRFADPASAIARARDARVLVRDVRGYSGLQDALRITLGTPAENLRLLVAWA